MNISVNWIKKYVSLDAPVEDIVNRLKAQLGEVEYTEDLAKKYKGVLVAQIEKKELHPSSEKLAVYQIDTGDQLMVQVVAGDTTLEVGDKVAYFLPGSILPNNANPEKHGDKVEIVSLRGVHSQGMLASAKELDISNNHEKVMRLDIDDVPGTTLIDALELNDTVIDIENKALTNRADCFGILGIARELAGIYETKFQTPQWYLNRDLQRPNKLTNESLPIKVKNMAGTLCPRYMAISLSGIEIKDSPLWLQSYISRCGVRPINNVVDITNYLMLLTGQPMHAFDYDKVLAKDPGKNAHVQIVVRNADPNEKITTLDGKTHELQQSNIVICDSTNPIAIGGVMGGLDTEIDSNSKNIILESANFDMYNIRKTSNQAGIISDAVTRYTRGQDPNQCETVLYEAIRMVKELAGGEIACNPIDNYANPVESWDINVSVKRLNSHLGTNFKKEDIIKTLDNVELIAQKDPKDQDLLIVKVPTFRRDLRIREDIHEEIGRLLGYEKVPISLPPRTIKPTKPNASVAFQSKVREYLVASGANEILTYNFIGAEDLKKVGQEPSLAHHIKNSLSPELEYMRTSLLPSVISKVRQNLINRDRFALFEINKSHNTEDQDEIEDLPKEFLNNALVYISEQKNDNELGSPYYVAKYYVDGLLSKLNIDEVQYSLLADTPESELPTWVKNLLPLFDYNSAALITQDKNSLKSYLGIVGNFSAKVKRAHKLPEYSAGYEINLNTLMPLSHEISNYREPSVYPKVVQDLTFTVDDNGQYADIEKVLNKSLSEKEYIYNVLPVDIYKPDENSKTKNITYRIELQSRTGTLESGTVAELMQELAKQVEVLKSN